MSDVIIVTIDGPSGSGKGTLAKRIAKELDFELLDSGALYRVLGLYTQNIAADINDEAALGVLAENLPVSFEIDEDADLVQVFLDNQDVSLEIRTELAGAQASKVAKIPAVRAGLLELQRSFAKGAGLVADGRDMGTMVFPQAQVKVFLEADVKERAKRRYKQLKEKGFDANLAALENELMARDVQDKERTASPLIPADDAVIIDSTLMSIEDVFEKVMTLVRAVKAA